MEFENLSSEFNDVPKEYLYNNEFEVLNEKIDETEEFYTKMKAENTAEKKDEPNSNLMNDSSFQSIGSSITQSISTIGSAASVVTMCIAAGIAIYSGGIYNTSVDSDNAIQYEQQVVLNEEPEVIPFEEPVVINDEVIEEIKEEIEEIKNFEVSSVSYTGVYDGHSHSGSLVNVPVGADITYGESRDSCTMTEIPEYSDAGEYTVYYKVEMEGYETYIGSFMVKIDKKIVVPPSPSVTPIVYNGKIQSSQLKDTDSYTCSGTLASTSAGTYKAELKLRDSRNYEWSDGNVEDKVVTWTIQPRELVINWPSQNEFDYNGERQVVAATLGNVVPGDFWNFTIKDHMATEPGEYKAEVIEVEISNNYILPKNRTYDWKIKSPINDDVQEDNLNIPLYKR